jgi:hypothetical protein
MTLDFWDITKLLLRQWRVALPPLLATVVLTVLTLVHVKPNYVSTAYVQLVAPIQIVASPGESPSVHSNPWLTQSLNTLGNAALVTVQDLTYAHRLRSEGYSDTYTVQLGGGNPLAIFTVTGQSRAQAGHTANVIVAEYEKNLADLQSSYGVEPPDMITGRRLDTGSNITISSGRVKRAVVLVIAVGLLTATASSVVADILARRRARKQAEAQAKLDVAAAVGPPASVDEAATADRMSRAAWDSNIAMSTAAPPATASARVPAANRVAPPGIRHTTERTAEPTHATEVAAALSGSDRPSPTPPPDPQTDTGVRESTAAPPNAPSDPRTERQRTERPSDRDRPVESSIAEDRPADVGDAAGTDEAEPATLARDTVVIDAAAAPGETVVMPKIVYANDK